MVWACHACAAKKDNDCVKTEMLMQLWKPEFKYEVKDARPRG